MAVVSVGFSVSVLTSTGTEPPSLAIYIPTSPPPRLFMATGYVGYKDGLQRFVVSEPVWPSGKALGW